MTVRTRILGLILSTFIVGTAACGSGPTAPTTYSTTVSGTVGSFGYSSHLITSPRAGTATVVLTWNSSAVDLDLIVTSSGCGSSTPSSCNYEASSSASVGTREQATFVVAANESFRVWIDSYALGTQSYTVSVTVS